MTRTVLCALMLALVASAVSAQRGEKWGWGHTDDGSLITDVYVLSRIVPLHLTGAQLEALSKLYGSDATPDATGPQSESLKQLLELRARLLLGRGVRPGDEAALKELGKTVLSEREDTAPGMDLLRKVEEILTPNQLAILALPRDFDLGGIRSRKAVAESALQKIRNHLSAPDDDWPRVRDYMAAALASGVADAEDQALTREDLAAFLDRLRRIETNAAEVQKDELAEELSALLPDGIPIGWEVPQMPGDGEGAEQTARAQALRDHERQRRMSIFAHPAMPRLVRELLATQAK